MNKDIVFWQNMPAHHQLGALRYLAKVWKGDVYGVFDLKILQTRKALGWECPDFGAIKVHFLNEMDDPKSFVKNMFELHTDAIHVLGGVRGCLSVNLAWEQIQKNKSIKLACISERPHFNSWKSLLQKIWYRVFFMRYGHRFKAFLVMGKIGVEEYRQLGVPSEILFPYMYQTSCIKDSVLLDREIHSEPIRFVYVGRFNQRKGVDVLLDALDLLPDENWSLAADVKQVVASI